MLFMNNTAKKKIPFDREKLHIWIHKSSIAFFQHDEKICVHDSCSQYGRANDGAKRVKLFWQYQL